MPTIDADAQAVIRADIGREVDRVATTSARYLDDLIGNARWFSTLVVAEVAALSKAAESTKGGLFWALVIALILLAASVACLILSINLSQSVKNRVQAATTALLVTLPATNLADATPDRITELLISVKGIMENVAGETEQQGRLTGGLWLFFIGSVLAGIWLFLR